MLNTIKLLGVVITNENSKKVLEYVVNEPKKLFITTPNPEILVYANAHPEYKAKLNLSDVALPDGIGLLMASYFVGKPLEGRITGVDFIEMLCKESKEKPMSMGFLGGRSGVAERAVDRLKKKYPWINVVFVGEEWSDVGFARGPVGSLPPASAPPIIGVRAVRNPSSATTPRSKENKIDILFVAFGAPRQEEWIYEHLPKLPVKAAMGVGGAFDYLSGDVMRAPIFVRKIGLEWLFRLIRQPWRWKRQVSLITFLFLVLKERLQLQGQK